MTYSLHIILRFELEQEIIDGTIDAADLPEVWNARMEEYLGVEVPDDAHGVLQDVHWSGGGFGYFPTYSLGNVDVGADLGEGARARCRTWTTQFERGEFGQLHEWLREQRSTRSAASSRRRRRSSASSAARSTPSRTSRYLKEKLGALAAA